MSEAKRIKTIPIPLNPLMNQIFKALRPFIRSAGKTFHRDAEEHLSKTPFMVDLAEKTHDMVSRVQNAVEKADEHIENKNNNKNMPKPPK